MSLKSWHEKGRPALFEALAVVCDKIEDDLEAEVKTKTQICKHDLRPGELENLRARAIEADRLEKDNLHLREALSNHEKEKAARARLSAEAAVDTRSVQGSSVTATGDFTISTQHERAIKEQEIARLIKGYKILQNEFNKAKELLAKKKKEARDWYDYAEKLKEKYDWLKAETKGLKARPAAPAVVPGRISEAWQIPEATQGTTLHSRTATQGGNQTTTLTSEVEERIMETQLPTQDEDPTQQDDVDDELPVIQAEPPEHARIKNEPVSDDLPMIISESAVRKRPLDDGSVPATPTRVSRLKGEASSPNLLGFSPEDSMDLDLDTVGATVETPRRGDLEDVNACSMQVEYIPSLSPVVTPDLLCQSTLEDDLTNRKNALKRNEQMRPLLSKSSRQPLVPIANTNKLPGSSSVANNRSLNQNSTIPPPNVARNDPALKSTTTEPRPRGDTGLSRVPSLSGLDVPQPRQLPFDTVVSRPDFHRSFHEEPLSVVLRQSRTNERNSSIRNRRMSPELRSYMVNRPAPAPAPKTGILRTKKPTELSLEDFKINPKFNVGVNFAYSEVVRSRADRAALPGCTDKTCCGQDFRMLARAERGNKPRTPEKRHADRIYLERYLGDDCYKLFGMTREEMDELWIEARAKEMADNWGKHRHRFARARSPPGFWNPDFPSTQEEREERQQVETRRRDEVEERYREAMRPGGRWLFRDE